MKKEVATFGGGCFWGVEESFRTMPGVTLTTVGYMGGTTENPTYDVVCTDTTGHAEVVQIEFEPDKVSYQELLKKFFTLHDPTELNRQGPDVGTQYRSVIFFHTPDQGKQAYEYVGSLSQSGIYKRPIVTQILSAQSFFKAEEYHQQYLAKRGLGTCHI